MPPISTKQQTNPTHHRSEKNEGFILLSVLIISALLITLIQSAATHLLIHNAYLKLKTDHITTQNNALSALNLHPIMSEQIPTLNTATPPTITQLLTHPEAGLPIQAPYFTDPVWLFKHANTQSTYSLALKNNAKTCLEKTITGIIKPCTL